MKIFVLIFAALGLHHMVCGEDISSGGEISLRAAPSGDSTYGKCDVGDPDDCGNGSQFCGPDSTGFCSATGSCYCADPSKNYDGVSPPKNSQMMCQESTGDEPCAEECSARKTVLSSKGKAYVCSIAGQVRCFCAFKIKSNFFPCTKKADCDGSLCTSGYAPECVAYENFGFCDCKGYIKGTKCKEDSYCATICYQATFGTGKIPGKACPAKEAGKGTCYCLDPGGDTHTTPPSRRK